MLRMELPPEPDGLLIHERNYSVRIYRQSPTSMLMRGIVWDEKPPGLYFEHDPEPLPVHHMVVDLVVTYPTLEITSIDVAMNVTPHSECTDIESTYRQLVGVSIARGFSRKLKELFIGPAGCTHIGALLQAMAPAAIQSIWSMRTVNGREGTEVSLGKPGEDEVEVRRRAMRFNINSCHVWAEDSANSVAVLAGEPLDPPIWAEERMKKLGVTEDEWAKF